MEGIIAQQEADNAELRHRNEENTENIEKLTSELAEQRLKDSAKAEQLKAIEQMTAEAAENQSKMSFDDMKEFLKRIRQLSMPGNLPLSVEESTAEQQLSAATPKKPVSTSFQAKLVAKKERRPLAPETVQPKCPAQRTRPAIAPPKPVSMPRKR